MAMRDEILKFLTDYYKVLDTTPVNIVGFYDDNSIFRFKDVTVTGKLAILTKLNNAPFTPSKNRTFDFDFIALSPRLQLNGGVHVLVSGKVFLSSTSADTNFSQFFKLMKDGSGDIIVEQDILCFN